MLVNIRCPLRCRHCAAGFSQDFKGVEYRIDRSTLVRAIEDIDPKVYQIVLFGGGEPTLDPDLVKLGIDACKRAGLGSGLLTAPIWAGTAVAAGKLLDKIVGLSHLFLSYDYYHLEFLKFRHYETAIHKARERGIDVRVHMVYSQERERQALIESLSSVLPMITLSSMRVAPLGNASSESIEKAYITILTPEDLRAIPRGCVAGNAYIDVLSTPKLWGCCFSSMGEFSPFGISLENKTVRQACSELEDNLLFGAVRQRGFLDSLSPRGEHLLAERVCGQQFYSECDLCLATMKSGNEDIWRECIH
jgi:pyruvate-formate lyase-activating enzyme